MSSRGRLTKTPAQYLATRDSRREFSYEAMLASGRTSWGVGDRVRVYRTRAGAGAVVAESRDADAEHADRRDYDVDHYSRLLRDTFAARLARAFAPADFESVFADPDQLSLFTPLISTIHSVLTTVHRET